VRAAVDVPTSGRDAVRTADTCCGERSTRLTYPAVGLWAGRWFCRDCASVRKKITRLSTYAS